MREKVSARKSLSLKENLPKMSIGRTAPPANNAVVAEPGEHVTCANNTQGDSIFAVSSEERNANSNYSFRLREKLIPRSSSLKKRLLMIIDVYSWRPRSHSSAPVKSAAGADVGEHLPSVNYAHNTNVDGLVFHKKPPKVAALRSPSFQRAVSSLNYEQRAEPTKKV